MKMFRRMYHVTSITFNYNKKLGVKLCKMVNPKSKKRWYPNVETDGIPTVKSLTKVKREPGKSGVRRVAMLNKLFMKQITDIMSTGTVSMEVVGHGIEISKVKITPDFQTVNVFWVCNGNSTDEEIEALLNKTAGALRHELSTLRVMGEVPYVVFVKDRNEASLVDLDRRLTIADYGEDYTPTQIGHLLKTEFVLNTKLSPELKAKIKQLEDELPLEEESIPEMTNNVFGLDHAKIMNRLLAARKRSKDAWNKLDSDSTIISYRVDTNSVRGTDIAAQKQELAEFLVKRQILQNKLHKQMRSSDDWKMPFDEEEDHKDEDIFYEDYESDEEYY